MWLVNGCPLWLSEAVNKSGEEGDASSLSYITKPFPKHEFEPHGWPDILATLDVCANVHAFRHFDDEGYDLISMNMVNFVLMEEVDKVTLEVNKAPKLDYLGSYNEEIIFEGSEVDISRINQRPLRKDEIQVSCMPLQM